MRNEGRVEYSSGRYGLGAFMRRKQWWYFEGLDEARKLYFVFNALEATPTSYVSLKAIDYGRGTRWAEEHFGRFRSAPGDAVDVMAEGAWGRVEFKGRAEDGWRVTVATDLIDAELVERPESSMHANDLLTKRIDYRIRQFVRTGCEGRLSVGGSGGAFSGVGYHEHNWGVQPRHSTAHWLHFWSGESAGVVLSCHYDEGLPHHYSFLWHEGRELTLASPAEFRFDPERPAEPWKAVSPDLELEARPLFGHLTRFGIPPLVRYIDVDYYEQLLEIRGHVFSEGRRVEIAGMGKLDFNWNRW